MTPGRLLPARWRRGFGDHVIALRWTHDGRSALAGLVGGGLVMLSRDGDERWRRDGHGFGLSSLACHPSSTQAVTGGQDGRVRVWNLEDGAVVADLDAGAPWVEAVRWNTAGTMLAAAAGRGVRVWSRDGVLVREWPKHRATVSDLQWQPGRDLLCSTSYGGVTLLDPAHDEPLRQFSWQGSSLVAQWSPSGKYIATGEQDSSVHFWIVDTGKDLQMTGYPVKIRELSWDHTSRYLATGGGNEAVVWDCGGKGPSGRTPILLPGHEQRVTAVAYQHGGSLLASGGADGRVVLWQPSAKKVLVGATQLSQAVSQLSWSPDDRELLAGCANGDVAVISRP